MKGQIMQVGFNEDQEHFREMVAKFLADKSPPSAVRTLMASEQGYDLDVWQQLSQELGLAGTHLPEQFGGFNFGPIELGIVSQEMGRYLYCGPFFASAIMSAYALLDGAEVEHKERLLPGLASGQSIASLVLDDLNAPTQVGESIKCQGETLTGNASMVLDAHVADVLIVVARAAEGLTLYEVDPQAVEIHLQESLDPTRKLCAVSFANTPASPLAEPGSFDIHKLWDHLCVSLAHEMVGGAEHLFESTVEYMKMRVQFGRAIGSFQALKHRCADLLLELEMAKAMAHEAARVLATNAEDQSAINMAKALAADAYMSIAKQAIQLRGGIGFTWEEDTHLWFKRAKSSEVFLGSPSWHREESIRRLEALGAQPQAIAGGA